MRFQSIVITTTGILAAAAKEMIEVETRHAANATAINLTACEPGYQYCGWFLVNNLGMLSLES